MAADIDQTGLVELPNFLWRASLARIAGAHGDRRADLVENRLTPIGWQFAHHRAQFPVRHMPGRRVGYCRMFQAKP